MAELIPGYRASRQELKNAELFIIRFETDTTQVTGTARLGYARTSGN